MGTDPLKMQIVRSCLEAASKDVRPAKPKGFFDFNDSDIRFEVELDRAFIDDIPADQLQNFLETNLLPKIRANPDKKFYVSNDGIDILNITKDSNSPR